MKSKDSHIGLISWGNGNSGSRDHSDIQRTRFCLVSSSSVGKGLPLRKAEGASRRNPEIRSLPFRGLGFWVWDWVLGLGSDWDFSLGSTERRLSVVRTPHPALESNLDNSSGRLLPPLITRFQVYFFGSRAAKPPITEHQKAVSPFSPFVYTALAKSQTRSEQ